MRRRATKGAGTAHGPLAAALCVALLLGSSASANLRAPVVVRESPSAALSAPGPRLKVERESLRFSCASASCDVTAEYEVAAEAATRVRLDFILPAESPVTAATNGETGAATVVPAQPLRPEEASVLPPVMPGAPALFRAGFESALRPGRNSVAVRYVQPLGAEEVGHGYGKKGRMVQLLRYELWPLREWRRSDGFRIHLAVSTERPAPGLWQRWFGTVRSLTCISSDPAIPLPEGRREQKGDELVYEVELGPAIPDRVTCYLGDEDLMPRH